MKCNNAHMRARLCIFFIQDWEENSSQMAEGAKCCERGLKIGSKHLFVRPQWSKEHILACICMVFALLGCVLLGLDSLRGGLAESNRITSGWLLDESQASAYLGKTPHTPHLGPFWAYLRTLPQGVELLVSPLVK